MNSGTIQSGCSAGISARNPGVSKVKPPISNPIAQ